MDHAGGSSSDGGGAPESTWPNSLDQLATEGLHRLGLLVSPGCRLAKPWRINKDGYPKGDALALRKPPLRRRYVTTPLLRDGKSYYAVVAERRRPQPDRRPRRFPRRSTSRRSTLSSARTATPTTRQGSSSPCASQAMTRRSGRSRVDEPLSYEYPLMLNWSEIKAKKRDEYDSENGRGHGKFDDVIEEDHREAKVAKEGTLPEVESQIVIERLKKEGLIYKPSFKDINPEENGVDESEVWVKRKYAPKYFPEVDSSPLGERQEEKNNASFTNMPIDEEVETGAGINGSGIGTPNDPFIVNGNNSPVRSSSSLPTNEFPKVTRTP
ncbi:hypothetical protein ZWY2020_040209 [Hordeum vulgare]|nr:hypothetical protein ZWY2020_040209 [Hordeum vulgare]